MRGAMAAARRHLVKRGLRRAANEGTIVYGSVAGRERPPPSPQVLLSRDVKVALTQCEILGLDTHPGKI